MNREVNQNRTYKYNTVVPEIAKDDSEDSLVSQKFAVDREERVCRICMDTESPSKQLLAPCRCRGTMKYIHEECLKTWLVSQEGSVDACKCELCKTEFLMEFKIVSKCTPRHMCHEGLTQCLFIPLLIAVMFMLFLIVYLLADRYISGENEDDKGYTIALMGTCLVSGLVILGLVVNAIKEACITSSLGKWVIFNQDFDESRIEDGQNQSQGDEQVVERSINSYVMVIPKTITVRGRTVETPLLEPSMQPVLRGDRPVAFTPAPFASAVRSLHSAMHSEAFKIDRRGCSVGENHQ